ncbi:MAG: hypothetical protein ACXWUG_15635 [Polyangiales bacterium]
MSLYPPPPPGWDSRLLQTPNQAQTSDAEQKLHQWAQARGYAYNPHPNVEWYRSWAPFVFLFVPTRVGREVRAEFGDAQIWLVEAFNDEETERGEEDRYVFTFLLSPALAYRAAIRSRMQKEAVDEMRTSISPRKTPRSLGRWRWRERDQFLRRTYGRGVRGVIGDAIFEAHCEVQTPSREEGLAALPVALRQWLITTGWRGVLELRPGGLVGTTYGPPIFDPSALDATIHHLGHIYNAAVRRTGPNGPSSAPASSGPMSGPYGR